MPRGRSNSSSYRVLFGAFACAAFLVLFLPVSALASGEQLSVKLSPTSSGQAAIFNTTFKASRVKVKDKISVTGTEIFLPKGAKLHTHGRGGCSKTKLEGGQGCPKAALLATGYADINTSYEQYSHVIANLSIYVGNQSRELLMAAEEPYSGITIIIPGRLRAANTAGFGDKIVFDSIPTEPLGPNTQVFMYLVDVSIKGVNVRAYRNPVNCSARGWRFGVRFIYDKGGSSMVSKHVSCKS